MEACMHVGCRFRQTFSECKASKLTSQRVVFFALRVSRDLDLGYSMNEARTF